MDREASRAAVHGVAKSQTELSDRTGSLGFYAAWGLLLNPCWVQVPYVKAAPPSSKCHLDV